MHHITLGVFGELENDFLKKLGNKGTINDLEFRNDHTDSCLYTYCAPKSEKVTSLMQSVGLVDIPVIVFDSPSPVLGEAVLAVQAHSFPYMIACVSEAFGMERAEALLSGAGIPSYKILPLDHIVFKEFIRSDEFFSSFPPSDGPVKVPIDNYFQVKSVGTVILGIVKQGDLGVYTKLEIFPTHTEVLVKSIQSQDKDVRVASAFQRVGLSLKGVKPDDLKRGYIVAQKDSLKVSESVTFRLERNNVIKDEVSVGDSFFACIGLQTPVGRVEAIDGDTVTMSLEREVAFDANDRVVIAKTTPKPPRIVGGGKLVL